MPPTNCFVFPVSTSCYWGQEWALWFSTKGKSGEEPPANVKHIMELYEKILEVSSLTEEASLMKEVMEIETENLFSIGLVKLPRFQYFYVCKNNFRNVPEASFRDISTNHPAQFFIKQ